MARVIDRLMCSVNVQGWREQWQSAFYQHDRLFTSLPFARSLGFNGILMPFTMLLNKAGTALCQCLVPRAVAYVWMMM